MGCCGGEDHDDHLLKSFLPPDNYQSPPHPHIASSSSSVVLSPMNSHFSALSTRDLLRTILELLAPRDLARSACVCRLWRAVASEREMQERAFRSPWKVRQILGEPSSPAFWRHPGIDRFAISHFLGRGDTVPGLALKYSVQRDAFWAAEMEKLKAELVGKGLRNEASPNPASHQDSCAQSKGQPLNDLGKCDTARKISVEDDVVHEEEDKPKGGDVQDDEADVFNEEDDKSNGEAVKEVEADIVSEDEEKSEGGTVKAVEAELAGNNEEKTSEEVVGLVDGLLDLSKRVLGGDDHGSDVVENTVGGTVADSNSTKRGKKGNLKKVNKTFKLNEDVEPEFDVEMDGNYPSALKRLWTWAKDALSDGRTLRFELSEEAFGSKKKQAMYLSDIHAVCSGGEMSGAVICVFIHFLNQYVKKHRLVNMIAFVDPSTIGVMGCGNAAQRSCALAARFKNARKGQLFLMPYNDVNHWTLTVANPEAEIVYHMNSLKHRIANGEWVEVVNNAIKLYREDLRRVGKKKISWENMAGVPVQKGDKDCAMFVMRYMKEIIYGKVFDFVDHQWTRRSNLVYTVDDINEIKTDFAKYFMKHHAS